jgi:hypothetical protein
VTERVYEFAIAAIGVWRISHLLTREDGPWLMFARLREVVRRRRWSDLLDCLYCASVWVAIPFAAVLSRGVRDWVLLWPALSGTAILLERITTQPAPPPARYFEHGFTESGELDDVMLRTNR